MSDCSTCGRHTLEQIDTNDKRGQLGFTPHPESRLSQLLKPTLFCTRTHQCSRDAHVEALSEAKHRQEHTPGHRHKQTRARAAQVNGMLGAANTCNEQCASAEVAAAVAQRA
jgi:hypothetical protein